MTKISGACVGVIRFRGAICPCSTVGAIRVGLVGERPSAARRVRFVIGPPVPSATFKRRLDRTPVLRTFRTTGRPVPSRRARAPAVATVIGGDGGGGTAAGRVIGPPSAAGVNQRRPRCGSIGSYYGFSARCFRRCFHAGRTRPGGGGADGTRQPGAIGRRRARTTTRGNGRRTAGNGRDTSRTVGPKRQRRRPESTSKRGQIVRDTRQWPTVDEGLGRVFFIFYYIFLTTVYARRSRTDVRTHKRE